MAVQTFRLQVPAESRFRALAAEVAARFVALVGGSDAEAASLEQTLEEAMASCGDSPDAIIHLLFRATQAELAVELTCGARSSIIRHPIPEGRQV